MEHRIMSCAAAGVCVPGGAAAAAHQWAQVSVGDGGQHASRSAVQGKLLWGAAFAGEQRDTGTTAAAVAGEHGFTGSATATRGSWGSPAH